MKTFHSTAVLRHLFTVHTFLAEFDIGFRALDTYLDIVTKGRARVEKSGIPESNLDDDETAIRTAAEGITILCRFRSLQQAEKARDLGRTLEQWLQQHHSDTPLQSIPNGQESAIAVYDKTSERSVVSPTGLAIAYRAIGISQAHWAELTYEATARAKIQATALQNLQKSLATEYGNSEDPDTLFALGMLSAKSRDLSAAIQLVKRALSSIPRDATCLGRQDFFAGKQAPVEPVLEQHTVQQKRRLLPFWHLLTLLMSAEQDWTTAVRSCAAAFEQFGDPFHLFGAEASSTFEEKYEGAPESSNQRADSPHAGRGAVDDMDLCERHGIVEIKMTQLALTEVLEGSEAAVNASNELLSLFTRLFGDLEVLLPRKFKPEATAPPQSASGTVRSMRGSLLGRPKPSHKTTHKSNNSVGSMAAPSTIPSTAARRSREAASAPTIQITSENGDIPKSEAHRHHHHHRLFRHDAGDNGQRLQKRSGSLNSKKSFGSFRRKGGSGSTTSATPPGRDQAGVPESIEEDNVEVLERGRIGNHAFKDENRRATKPTSTSTPFRAAGIATTQTPPPAILPLGDGRNESLNATQPLSHIAHNSHHQDLPLPLAHKHQTPHQDVRFPIISPHTSSTQPGPRFSKECERRHALSLLVKIWLLIASLYRRAGMADDARSACDEAFTHVASIEAEVAAQTPSSSRAFGDRDWGYCKSVEELWGDIYAERANLAQTLAAPQEAIEYYERALFHCLDHPAATVGLANLLLDVYTQTAPATENSASSTSDLISTLRPSSPIPGTAPLDLISDEEISTSPPRHDPSPSSTPLAQAENETTHLDRLAARDRAHGLLSSLTKLGSGWDNSEAWFALARACEEGGQVEKAKELLWWCVELEDTRPVRGWGCVGFGGYVL